MSRTNIEIDDSLIAKVMKITGARTKREAVKIALEKLAHRDKIYSIIKNWSRPLKWSGNIDRFRRDRI